MSKDMTFIQYCVPGEAYGTQEERGCYNHIEAPISTQEAPSLVVAPLNEHIQCVAPLSFSDKV
jgi:hypothetical protein